MSTPSAYRMIGADGREYGPIPADQLRQWIKEGRADRFTQIRPEGESWWKPLGQFAEFADLLPASASLPAQPASSAGGPASSQPPLAPLTSMAPTSGYPSVQTGPKLDNMAIAGVICSGLGLICCCGGPVFSGLGLAFSLIGLSNINKDPVNRSGKGLAIAGIVMGAIGLLMFIAFLVSNPWRNFPFHDLLRELNRL